jgi:hypothetical protein
MKESAVPDEIEQDYQHRLRAVEDATRLVRGLYPEPVKPPGSSTYYSSTVPVIDRFDVLEVARFLLDEEGEPVRWEICPDCDKKTPIAQSMPTDA